MKESHLDRRNNRRNGEAVTVSPPGDNRSVMKVSLSFARYKWWPQRAGVGLLLVLLLVVAPLPAQDENPDDIVYDRVIRQLVNDRQLKTNALDVAVEEGAVTVTGMVETEKLRRRVDKIVKKVKGVKRVVNQVRVRR